MKSFYILIAFLTCSLAALADNLTATHTDADFGMNNGTINLVITGGTTPYVISWTGPGGYTSSASSLSSLTPGTYCVTVTDYYCGVATLCITVAEKPPTGIPLIAENNNFAATPNPFNDKFRIDFGAKVSGQVRITLGNMWGQTVYTTTMELDNKQYADIQMLQMLPPGIYDLIVQVANKHPFAYRMVCGNSQ